MFFVSPEFIPEVNLDNGISVIGLGAILVGMGVPIGYLIHQVSMLFGFIVWTNRKKYFKQEFELDLLMYKHDNAEKIKNRYVHLLTRVHELRALTFSHILSIVTIVLIALFILGEVDKYFWTVIIINLFFLIVSFSNQRYFTDNLEHYKKEIKRNHN